jgi:hypothetical protein
LIEHVTAGTEITGSAATDMPVPHASDCGPIESLATVVLGQEAEARRVALGDVQDRLSQCLKDVRLRVRKRERKIRQRTVFLLIVWWA